VDVSAQTTGAPHPTERVVTDEYTIDLPLAGLSEDTSLRLAMLSLENSTDWVYWFDETARVVYANAAARQGLGCSREEVSRLMVTDILPTGPADGPASSPDTFHRHKDGRLIPGEMSTTNIAIGGSRFAVVVVRVPASTPARIGLVTSGPENSQVAGDVPQVLVVEDSRLNQRVARVMLERMGIVVEMANDGREAVEAMRRGPDRFDAILMDMEMPGMDGLEATRAIRTEFPHRAVPIIATTANDLGAEKVACLAAGMNDHVSKPIDAGRLQAVLARWVKVASTVPAPKPAPALPSLRGVDVGSALARLGGDRDLFVRLLRHFVQEHAAGAATMADAIARDDSESALRLAHTLKGVAGTLSVNAVHEAAQALEVSLRQGRRETLPAHVERLGAALDVVCRSVAGWAGEFAPSAATPAPPEPAQSVLGTLVAEFDGLLKNRRFSARKQFESLKKHAPAPELAGKLVEIQRCLDGLDFSRAQDLLPALAEALGVPLARGSRSV
jgi:CheY-like chemotaxis protein/HPt (histidine-containing phosphotransfer) domain-containing protein